MLTVKELEAYCRMMTRYGVTRMVVEGLTLERPLQTIPTKDELNEPEDPLRRLARMSPEAQDRELALAPLGPPEHS